MQFPCSILQYFMQCVKIPVMVTCVQGWTTAAPSSWSGIMEMVRPDYVASGETSRASRQKGGSAGNPWQLWKNRIPRKKERKVHSYGQHLPGRLRSNSFPPSCHHSHQGMVPQDLDNAPTTKRPTVSRSLFSPTFNGKPTRSVVYERWGGGGGGGENISNVNHDRQYIWRCEWW